MSPFAQSLSRPIHRGYSYRSIVVMKNIDYTSVDGSLLRTFLVVLEEHSASAAAARLGVAQSTVSHALAKLRRFTNDQLCVRSGQALEPTEVALSLKEPVQSILDDLRGLTHRKDFNPASEDMRFVIAANDMQRDLVFPQLVRELQSEHLQPNSSSYRRAIRHSPCCATIVANSR